MLRLKPAERFPLAVERAHERARTLYSNLGNGGGALPATVLICIGIMTDDGVELDPAGLVEGLEPERGAPPSEPGTPLPKAKAPKKGKGGVIAWAKAEAGVPVMSGP